MLGLELGTGFGIRNSVRIGTGLELALGMIGLELEFIRKKG